MMKYPPRPVGESVDQRPEAAALAGEYGTVMISGIVTEDGRFVEAAITGSSRSQLIDAAALEASARAKFEPARDSDRNPISFPIVYAVEFAAVDFRGERSILEYRCSQAVRDHDWWRATWPEGTYDRTYKTLAGYAALSELRGAFVESVQSFEDDWVAAIEACRDNPERKFIDQLKTYGVFIENMVRSRR
jgi:TonB family protein